MKMSDLLDYTGQRLQPDRFKDYCPNGLQVEGVAEVNLLVTGVTASMALLEAAVESGAEAVLVHHGWFWKGEDMRLMGARRQRIKFVLAHDLNLMAYHLPLDAHPELGNNAQLAARLGFMVNGWFGEQQIAAHGCLPEASTLAALCAHIEQKLARSPLLIGEPQREVKRVAWCSGAAQEYLALAIEQGVDVFVTGEVSEQTVHLARESGVAFIAAGHHATERYGVQALGEAIARQFGIRHLFVDIDNPV